ncbi:MAG: Flp pilus assembly protein CpaB, partial [Gammaproteobacteria bacterium]|nr:Flp pilus assembly protein CpaB [Gammaproteobacteria bacterium]
MATVSDKDGSGWGGKSLLIGAIGFGLAAALLSIIYLKSREAALLDRLKGPDDQEVAVVVAKRELPRGAPVTQDNFAVRRIPSRFVHADAVRPGDFSSYEGNAIDTQLAVGKTLLKSFMDSDFPKDFSDIIDKGRRAMTIQVDELNSIAGFIRPGNRVDLFVNVPLKNSAFDAKLVSSGLLDSIPPEYQSLLPPAIADVLRAGSGVPPDQVEELLDGAAPKDVILPVLQNVKVLATGRDAYRASLDALRYPQPRTERSFSTITIDVDPREASLLTAAEDKGDLLALLRNREDESGAGFTAVTPVDLFANAFSMAEEETARRGRVSTAAGVDRAGNLVDADGNTLMNREQLEAAGYKVNDKGQIVDADGNVVDPKDLVLTADGQVLNKQQLAAAGLTVDENGQITDANGNVVRADDIVIAGDGSVQSREALARSGLMVNADGEIVDATGRVVDADELVELADGTMMTRKQLEEAGLSVDGSG